MVYKAPGWDKHSTGGVGDKVSFLVGPLAAACGVKAPMISGRGLGHTGGTLDKAEAIPGLTVDLDPTRFREVLNRAGMALAGQTEDLVPADRRLYTLRDLTATVGSIPLVASSILSKKLAVGADALVLDVKTGRGAFFRRESRAIELARAMVELGEASGRPTMALVTSMDQPLGHAVGNAPEIREVIETLKGRGPEDLKTVTFAVASAMLEAGGAARDRAHAEAMLDEALASGAALERFRAFVEAQAGDPAVVEDPDRVLPEARTRGEVLAGKEGYVKDLDALTVGMAACDLGAGRMAPTDVVDPGAGLVLEKKAGDPVKRGEVLARMAGKSEEAVFRARERLTEAFVISDAPGRPAPLVRYRVDRDGVMPWR